MVLCRNWTGDFWCPFLRRSWPILSWDQRFHSSINLWRMNHESTMIQEQHVGRSTNMVLQCVEFFLQTWPFRSSTKWFWHLSSKTMKIQKHTLIGLTLKTTVFYIKNLVLLQNTCLHHTGFCTKSIHPGLVPLLFCRGNFNRFFVCSGKTGLQTSIIDHNSICKHPVLAVKWFFAHKEGPYHL